MVDKSLKNAKKVALLGCLVAVGMVLSWLEFMIPFDFGVPGIKLGLANSVVVFALARMKPWEALAVSVTRIVLSGLLFTGPGMMIYALCGGLLSFTVMLVLIKLRFFSVVGVSAAGGVAHNLGQLICAAVMTTTQSLMWYFPVLLVTGVITGTLIGIISGIIIKRLKFKS